MQSAFKCQQLKGQKIHTGHWNDQFYYRMHFKYTQVYFLKICLDLFAYEMKSFWVHSFRCYCKNLNGFRYDFVNCMAYIIRFIATEVEK